MNKDEAIEKMRAIDSSDNELAHVEADCVLLEYLEENGLKWLSDEWHALNERTASFWYS